MFYCIDLERSKLEVMSYTPEILKQDLEYFGVKNALDLNSPDWRVFKSAELAEHWLLEYKATLNELKKIKSTAKKNAPTILYKRRYLVQTLMNEKTFTSRSSKRVIKMLENLKSGDYFNLTDQTYTIAVKLKKTTPLHSGAMLYDFELP